MTLEPWGEGNNGRMGTEHAAVKFSTGQNPWGSRSTLSRMGAVKRWGGGTEIMAGPSFPLT